MRWLVSVCAYLLFKEVLRKVESDGPIIETTRLRQIRGNINWQSLSYIFLPNIRLMKYAQECFSFQVFMMHGNGCTKFTDRMIQMEVTSYLTKLDKSLLFEYRDNLPWFEAWDRAHVLIG